MFRRTFVAAATVAAFATTPVFAEGHSMDIVDTAVEAGTFTTLAAALEAAGLVETLKGEGPFTVFAPTDEAFAALPEGTVEGLLADTEALTAILTYHVVPGKVMSGDLSDGMTAATVNGASEVEKSQRAIWFFCPHPSSSCAAWPHSKLEDRGFKGLPDSFSGIPSSTGLLRFTAS